LKLGEWLRRHPLITERKLTLRVVEALDKCAIPYLLAGAFSSNQYGIPRATKYADFVRPVEICGRGGFRHALGEPFELDPSFHFRNSHRHLPANSQISWQSFSRWNWFLLLQRPARSRAIPASGGKWKLTGPKFWLPSAEDVIVTKPPLGAPGGTEDDVPHPFLVGGVPAGKIGIGVPFYGGGGRESRRPL